MFEVISEDTPCARCKQIRNCVDLLTDGVMVCRACATAAEENEFFNRITGVTLHLEPCARCKAVVGCRLISGAYVCASCATPLEVHAEALKGCRLISGAYVCASCATPLEVHAEALKILGLPPLS